jgi:energy-converting hydrogenase Eha subunit F
MSRIGRFWNSLATPKKIPRFLQCDLGSFTSGRFYHALALNDQQLYPRPTPQLQIDENDPLAPYDRGGVPLKEPGIVKSQYPQFSEKSGMVTSYLSPIAIGVSNTTIYYGTSIYSSPGGLIDEILYYSRGFDTILESHYSYDGLCGGNMGCTTLYHEKEGRRMSASVLVPTVVSPIVVSLYVPARFTGLIVGLIGLMAIAYQKDDLNALILTDIVGMGMLILVAAVGTDLAEALILPGLVVELAEILAISEILMSREMRKKGETAELIPLPTSMDMEVMTTAPTFLAII